MGTAVLSTMFSGAAGGDAYRHPGIHAAAVAAAIHGYRVMFWWAAGLFALGVLDALFVLPSGRRIRILGEIGEQASRPVDRKTA